MSKKAIQEMVNALYGESPIITWVKTASAEEKASYVEELDAEIEAATDPEKRRALEAEARAFRVMLRVYS